MRPSHKLKGILLATLPEGFSFFTKNPQHKRVWIYRENKNKLIKVNFIQNRLFNNLGINRIHRSHRVELHSIISSIPNRLWFKCDSSIELCKKNNKNKIFQFKNRALRPEYCGQFLLSYQKLVPWVWRKSKDSLFMPALTSRINVECKTKEKTVAKRK
ncbi:MAG: hypothetical protein CME68_01610 [Halobacteriovoraceae bacterium]|nr:hypothetical protein [Halobacteriovoraceae bacterium]